MEEKLVSAKNTNSNVNPSMPKIRGFKIASLNIDSLPKHIDELRIVMSNNDIYVLAIIESRLDSNIPNDLISIYGYSWVGKHRNRSGGGVGFFIRDTINYRIRSDLNDLDIEILTIELSKNKNKAFLIRTWYRPLNDPMDTLYKFENCLKLIDKEDKESIIV